MAWNSATPLRRNVTHQRPSCGDVDCTEHNFEAGIGCADVERYHTLKSSPALLDLNVRTDNISIGGGREAGFGVRHRLIAGHKRNGPRERQYAGS